MARNEERRRVHARLGALTTAPSGTRAVPGGRWDLDEWEPQWRSTRETGPRCDDRCDTVDRDGGFDTSDREDETDRDGRVYGTYHRGIPRGGVDRDDPDDGPRTPQWLAEPPRARPRWHERLIPERFRGTRLDPGPRGALVLAAVGVAAVLLAAGAVMRERPVAQPVPPLPAVRADTAVAPTTTGSARPAAPAAGAGGAASASPGSGAAATVSDAPAAPGDAAAELVVSVIGLVAHPGLLRLAPGSRVADAVSRAGPEDGADLAGLNFAQRLADGDQIVVGALGPHPGPPQLGSVVVPGGPGTATGVASGAGAASGSGGVPVAGPAAKVDLNTGTESDFEALPGIGPTTARAIVAWRAEHGRFTSVDQLAEVTGIGPARLDRLRESVTA